MSRAAVSLRTVQVQGVLFMMFLLEMSRSSRENPKMSGSVPEFASTAGFWADFEPEGLIFQ